MSGNDSIFIDSDDSVGEAADRLAELLCLEPIPEGSNTPDEVGLRTRAAEAEDGWIGLLVRPNGYVEPDPAPDDVQAIDGYPIELTSWHGGRDEAVLRREALRIFELVVKARPDRAALLCRNVTMLIAAHLPGAGTKYFDPGITLDVPDIDQWRPWIP